tara:strand:+ start:3721 stop:5097 length:1377 start_codon:yes stop_codon:yes gene_type:complete
MVSDMIFYLPSAGKTGTDSINLSTPDNRELTKRLLDYIFIYYNRDRGNLESLDDIIENQDDAKESKGETYTEEHIDLLYEKTNTTLNEILTMDLGELILNNYKNNRMEIDINWKKLFDTEELENSDVEDVETLKVQDIFSDDEMERGKAYKLTGGKPAKVRQQMNRISKGKGISDDIIKRRIQEKGKFRKIESGNKQKYEIKIPIIKSESPLSNQKIIRDAGISFRIENVDDPKRVGKNSSIIWRVSTEEFKPVLDSNNEAEFFDSLMLVLQDNPPVESMFEGQEDMYHPYEDVRKNMELEIEVSFFKGNVWKAIGSSSVEELKDSESKSNYNIPVDIKINYKIYNTFTFELGGKQIKGKVKDRSLSDLKVELENLEEQLETADSDGNDERAANIEREISDLKDNITDREGTEEKEVKEKSTVIPELKIYFDTIKGRINKLEKSIEKINLQKEYISED